MKIRVCKSCGTENSPADIECSDCMGDISGIRPVEKVEIVERPEPDNADSSSKTIQDVRKTSVLVLVSISAARNGDILPIKDGDILGREHVGKDLLAAFGTVGRRHAKIIFCNGEWTIEDLGSMNGTYINGGKLEAGQKYPFKAKDIVALSKSCELLVEIGGMKT